MINALHERVQPGTGFMTSIEPIAPASLLVVDDEPELRSLLNEYFGRHAYTVRCAADAAQARTMIAESAPHLAILDVNMPGENGLSLARWLRESHPATAIVMLTTAGESVDRIVGLELGADDYVPKPFEPRELVARVQTILRRQRSTPAAANGNGTQHRVFDGLSIDLDRRQVLRHGERVELTGTEFELLALLAAEPGKVFSRDDILNRLRGHEAELYTRAVDIVVSRLRKKLEPLDCIKTLRNAGYALAVARSESA